MISNFDIRFPLYQFLPEHSGDFNNQTHGYGPRNQIRMNISDSDGNAYDEDNDDNDHPKISYLWSILLCYE